MLVLETDRLQLRHIVPADFDDLFRMNSDPEIMKYVGDGSVRNKEQMKQELEMLISHYTRKPGLGIWATVLKETNTFIGASGLVYYDDTPEIEIGYRMLKEHWNKGYATEASFGLLKYGFEIMGLKKLVSSAHPENMASRRVMEKIGMTYIHHCFQYGCIQAYYEITLEEYQQKK
ncbi:GNAT family N-acetyltransferase [Chondrinema litorale]|uniref:GNAT family N-acetyltransferase n=1 Tax=Chondrinema litorale TaxID=2994555 RepID=UPI002543450C|nr:GNAT family N-acetyltransferase [Chondrinema litorale]UZR95266.1 GNAT family N-acetyltransferase [Chondrinema litorale]